MLGLLLVPAAELHERIDGALGGADAGAHHHEEVGAGLLGVLEHGVHDALLAQVVIVPLALLAFTVLANRERPAATTRTRTRPCSVPWASSCSAWGSEDSGS